MDLGSSDAFDRMGTLGVEEEFFVVDENGRPTSGTDTLVYGSESPEILDGRLDHELFKFTIETQTPLMSGIHEAEEKIYAVREALVEHAADHGFRVAAAGLHPAAKWRELEHAEKERYRAQLERIQYPQHRNTTAGLHVHVGVDDGDKAVWIANELRWYLPVMLALSANSPYWNGFDTGLQSARAKIFEGLPNTGMPTRFDDLANYLTFERRMAESGSINDRGELWYDVRPHTGHGSVEVRTPDAQTDPERTLTFVRYVYELVVDLAERYEDGESGADIRRELLDENKWRAMRYGREASFITPDCEATIELGDVVEQEANRLGVTGLRDLYDGESAAERQRRVHEESGLDGLCESLTLS
jgi:carboxylate-amine ligase